MDLASSYAYIIGFIFRLIKHVFWPVRVCNNYPSCIPTILANLDIIVKQVAFYTSTYSFVSLFFSVVSTSESNDYTDQSYKSAAYRPRPSYHATSSTPLRNRPLLQCIQSTLFILRQAQSYAEQAHRIHDTLHLPQESSPAADLLAFHEF